MRQNKGDCHMKKYQRSSQSLKFEEKLNRSPKFKKQKTQTALYCENGASLAILTLLAPLILLASLLKKHLLWGRFYAEKAVHREKYRCIEK